MPKLTYYGKGITGNIDTTCYICYSYKHKIECVFLPKKLDKIRNSNNEAYI